MLNKMKLNIRLRWLSLAGTTGALLLMGGTALHADTSRVEELEQRIQLLESQLESLAKTANPQSGPAVSAKDAPKLSVGNRGIAVESSDQAFRFQVNGLAQLDSRFYLQGGASGVDTFDARRVRPTLRGTLWNDLEFRFTPELSGTVRILDAYGDYRISDALRIQFGNFKAPVGLERLQGGGSIRFNERGYATEFTPARDLGIQLHGRLWDRVLAWKLGVFNGAVDGYNGAAATDVNQSFDLAGSLFVNPFKESDFEALRGLGFGVAASWGRQNRDAAFRVRSTSRLDVARGNLHEEGTAYRLNPQLTYYYGAFGFLGEYIISSRHLAGSAAAGHRRYTNHAWTTQVSYMLTGEENGYGGIRPKNPFKWGGEGLGAWEIAARYTGVSLDKALWANGLLGVGEAKRAQTWSVGLNWYLTSNLKAAISYDNTRYEGGKAGGDDRKSDHALLTRFQVEF